jgi:hypothetical protein
MSFGQMVEDVELAVAGSAEVAFFGRPGGQVSTPEEVARIISTAYHRAAGGQFGGANSAGGTRFRVLG